MSRRHKRSAIRNTAPFPSLSTLARAVHYPPAGERANLLLGLILLTGGAASATLVVGQLHRYWQSLGHSHLPGLTGSEDGWVPFIVIVAVFGGVYVFKKGAWAVRDHIWQWWRQWCLASPLYYLNRLDEAVDRELELRQQVQKPSHIEELDDGEVAPVPPPPPAEPTADERSAQAAHDEVSFFRDQLNWLDAHIRAREKPREKHLAPAIPSDSALAASAPFVESFLRGYSARLTRLNKLLRSSR